MRTYFIGLSIFIFWVLGGCGKPPRTQWVVMIGTDAMIPQFGDRVQVDVLDSRGNLHCEECTRVLSAGDEAQWPLSFGILLPSDRATLFVRARLFRADHTRTDGGITATSLDMVGQLPEPDGITNVMLHLPMNCFGIASQLSPQLQSCDPNNRKLAAAKLLSRISNIDEIPKPGTWPAGISIPCKGAPSEMACISGGIFLLGGVRFFHQGNFTDPLPEHLVKVSPFFIDKEEFTVGQIRSLVNQGKAIPEPVMRGTDPSTDEYTCTYIGKTDFSNDNMPVSCASFDTARSACLAVGKRLPTEAEWEYAAGNLSYETDYPWGGDEDLCGHAIVARGRSFLELGGLDEDDTCRGAGSGPVAPWGPVPKGSPRDITLLGIRNLAGNVAEWTDGGVAGYSDSCWNPAGQVLLVNPNCASPPVRYQGLRMLRGASWAYTGAVARNVTRAEQTPGPSKISGFRCAKSMP